MGCGGTKNLDKNRYFQKTEDRRILAGKNVLVTGGNRGLGKEIVRLFAEVGANIIFNSSVQNEKAEQLAREIAETYGVECYYCPCDIRYEDQIDKMIQMASDKLKRIDILVNNAGKAYFGDVESLSLNDFNECVDINLTSVFLFCQKVLPMMKKNRWGRVINFTTGTTQIIQPNLSAYVAAKNGVNALTKVLAKEVGEYGITVNSLVPGPMDTDMFNGGIDGFATSLKMDREVIKKQVLSVQIIKEPVQPKDLAEMCLYLCSSSGQSQTGGLFRVDNGFTC